MSTKNILNTSLIIEQMRSLNMTLPPEKVRVNIPDSQEVLHDVMAHFLQ